MFYFTFDYAALVRSGLRKMLYAKTFARGLLCNIPAKMFHMSPCLKHFCTCVTYT